MNYKPNQFCNNEKQPVATLGGGIYFIFCSNSVIYRIYVFTTTLLKQSVGVNCYGQNS